MVDAFSVHIKNDTARAQPGDLVSIVTQHVDPVLRRFTLVISGV